MTLRGNEDAGLGKKSADSTRTVRRPKASGRLPRELRLFWLCSFGGLVLTVLVGWVKYHTGQTRFNWDPLSDPLFGDLDEHNGTYTLLHQASFFFNVEGQPWPYPMFSTVAYPPFAAAIMAPLYGSPIPALTFLIVAGLWLAAITGWAIRALMRAGIESATSVLLPVTLVCMSFPILRLVHEGNIELVLWMFVLLGVWAFWREHDSAAAVFWGLAAAMKFFPIILLILLLPRRRYAAFFAGVASFAGATVLSLWWLGPSMRVAWRGSLMNVFGYQGQRVSEWTLRELVANHSVVDIAKFIAIATGFPLAKLSLVYYLCGAVIMTGAFFGKLWKMPVANQLLAVSTFMVMFPPISYYHALVHMYAPLAVLAYIAIRADRACIKVRGLLGTMLLFIPLFSAFTLLTYPTRLLYCGLIQGVVLIVIFCCALEFPFAVPLYSTDPA